MKSLLRQSRVLIAAVMLPLLALAIWAVASTWTVTAPLRGRYMAKFDLARGHYEVKTYGLASGWSPHHAALLWERYRIEKRAVAGCVVDDALEGYVKAYDAVVKAEMDRRFKHDVFAECANEAEQAYIAGTRAHR